MQAGAKMVKLEGGAWLAPTVAFLVERGIPVCGHLGLTPQSVHALGGYRVQGRSDDEAERLLADARALDAAGAAMLVLELVPSALAERVTQAVGMPTIGIGAGGGTSGQVLVLHDMLDVYPGRKPRFVRNFMQGQPGIGAAVARLRGGREGPELSRARARLLAALYNPRPPLPWACANHESRPLDRSAARPAARPEPDRVRADHGQPARGPSRADEDGAPARRPGGRVDLREPPAVRPQRGLRQVPAHAAGRHRQAAEAERRLRAVRAERTGDVPGAAELPRQPAVRPRRHPRRRVPARLLHRRHAPWC